MNQPTKQPTLFESWRSSQRKGDGSGSKTVLTSEMTNETSEEDLLLARAMEISLAEYEAAQAGPSTRKSIPEEETVTETLPGFDIQAGRTWIYPTNYPMRQYQFSIVQEALFKNTMVILPTGLGKTFIAAVVMYNFYRWYPSGKIVFMAPTKPLVAQQIEACFHIMGIPLDDSAEMTGTMSPINRKETWEKKRVFFITPHVMNNDLARGICPAKNVRLLVFDEAHKAMGNYPYCQLVNEVSKYLRQFRVLALSATPGNDLPAVKQVLSNLLISHVEFRNDTSIDIQPYTFERKLEKITVPLGEELQQMIERILCVMTFFVDRLKSRQVYYCHKVSDVSQFGLILARQKFRQNLASKMGKQQCTVIEGDFCKCITICHAYELLGIYGMKSFFNFIQDFFDGQKGNTWSRTELLRHETLIEVMDFLRSKFDSTNPDICDEVFISHPKLTILLDIIRNHFQSFEEVENKSSTRVMVFSAFRDSVVEIADLLNKHRPLIRAMAFTGQAASSSRSKGISQKEQIAIVKQFRSGGYNTLVATCVGEEGLDIGDIDLIVCYDAYKSPIRLIQRIGRTGRKREGRVVMLTTEGKEEQSYSRGKKKTNDIHKFISKTQFDSLYPGNPRMVPKGLNPKCLKMHMTIPDYQISGKRKKSKQSTVTPNTSSLKKFLSQHGRNSFNLDDDEEHDDEVNDSGNDGNKSSDDDDQSKNMKTKRKKPIKSKMAQVKKKGQSTATKPRQVKLKKVLVLDDSSDDAELLNHPFVKEDVKKIADENLAIDLDNNRNSVEVMGLPVLEDREIESDHSEASNNGENIGNTFFKLPDNNITDFEESKVGLKCRFRKPPDLTEVFALSKTQLSPVDYDEILRLSCKEGSEDGTCSPEKPIRSKTTVQNAPVMESLGFDFAPTFMSPPTKKREIYSESPETPSATLGSPVITSNVTFQRTCEPVSSPTVIHSSQEEERLSFQHCNSHSIYTTTQLVEMVQCDSMSLLPRRDGKSAISPLLKPQDERDAHANPIDDDAPQFDLNFDFDDGSMDSNVIPPSPLSKKQNNAQDSDDFKDVVTKQRHEEEEEEPPPSVQFNLNFEELSQPIETEIESREVNHRRNSPLVPRWKSGDWINLSKLPAKPVHSTPMAVVQPMIKNVTFSDEKRSDLEWDTIYEEKEDESFVSSKKLLQKKPLGGNLRTAKLKRRLAVGFIDTEAEIDTTNASTDESENSSLDEMDASFIDDMSVAEQSMSAVYLRSVKDCVGPRKFQLPFQNNSNDVRSIERRKDDSTVPSSLTASRDSNSDYQQDSFCVGDDHIEFSSQIVDDIDEESPVIRKRKKGHTNVGKPWKRIVVESSSDESSVGRKDGTSEECVDKTETVKSNSTTSVTTKPETSTANFDPCMSTFERLNVMSGEKDSFATRSNNDSFTSSFNNQRGADDNVKSSQLMMLIDSREINGTQNLVSALRHQHKVQTNVAKLSGCDYIVSIRMGVERRFMSDVSNPTNRQRIIERIQTMFEMFDRPCLIVEADRLKFGLKGKTNSSSIYFDRLTSAMLQLPLKLLYSSSQEETALLLKELVEQEKSKGFGITVDLNLSKKEEQLCRLYQKIPCVSYITAVNLCKNFLSVQQLVNSCPAAIQKKGSIIEKRAKNISEFLRRQFSDAL